MDDYLETFLRFFLEFYGRLSEVFSPDMLPKFQCSLMLYHSNSVFTNSESHSTFHRVKARMIKCESELL